MISVTALQQNNKIIYVGLLSTLTVFLLMDYIPVLAPFSRWVTPPVSLFLGLIFALVCGQAHPKFNKKVSKYLLQYSVVGIGVRYESSGFFGFRQGRNGIYDHFCNRYNDYRYVYRA